MRVSSVALIFFLLVSSDCSANALAIGRRDVKVERGPWARQGFTSLGAVNTQDGNGQPSTDLAGIGSQLSNSTDPDDRDDGLNGNLNVGVTIAPLPNLVLPVAGSTGNQKAADQTARRDTSKYQLWYDTTSIQSADGVVLYSVPTDPTTLEQALQEMHEFAQAQSAAVSDHVQVDGGNLSMLVASAVTDPSQAISCANVGQMIETLLRDLQADPATINSTYVGVIKDAQQKPLINMAIGPQLIDDPNPANGTINGTLPGGATGDSTTDSDPASATETSGPGRGLKGSADSPLQTTQKIPRTSLTMTYVPLGLTATRAVMNGLVRAATDTIVNSRSLLDGYVEKVYFTAPGANLALNVDMVGTEKIIQVELKPAMQAIQHATWRASRLNPGTAGKVHALQGIIFQGTKALATWYFNSIPASEYGADAASSSSSAGSYVKVVHDEL